jgi:hypothetical protein
MILAQNNLSTTNATQVFNNSKTTEIRVIHICNVTASAITYRIHYAKNGGSYSTSNALFYDINLPGNTSDIIEYATESFVMGQTRETIGIRCNTADALTYTIHGLRK